MVVGEETVGQQNLAAVEGKGGGGGGGEGWRRLGGCGTGEWHQGSGEAGWGEFIPTDGFYHFALDLEESMQTALDRTVILLLKFSGVVGLFLPKHFVLPPEFQPCVYFAAAILEKKIYLYLQSLNTALQNFK